MKKILSLILLMCMVLTTMAGCKKNEEVLPVESAPAVTENPDAIYENKIFFTIEMESGEVMKGELYPDVAPETVENFVKLCKKNFYDGK